MDKAYFFVMSLILMFSTQVYGNYLPVLLMNISADPNHPYVIENLNISNPKGECIKIINCTNIVVRGNYIYNCGTNISEEEISYEKGYAIIVGNSTNVSIISNNIINNLRGVILYRSRGLKVFKNRVINTSQDCPLCCEACNLSYFLDNILIDNGNPLNFWSGRRSIGIWIKKSNNINIRNNTIIRSTSDGIAVTGHIYGPSFTVPDVYGKGPRDDFSGYSKDITISNNVLLDNMEQGVWLVNVKNASVFNNTIRTGCFTHGSSIFLEFNAGNVEIYNNKLLTCLSGPISGAYSYNIHVFNNFFYYFKKDHDDFVYIEDNDKPRTISSIKGIAPYNNSHNIYSYNNKWVKIDGVLGREMSEKNKYASLLHTYNNTSLKMRRELLKYSNLMYNFDEYAIRGEDNKRKHPLSLFLFIVFFFLLSFFFLIRKRIKRD